VGGSVEVGEGKAAVVVPAAAAELTGEASGAMESVESILAASGFERAERLGRFLVSAQPADLERLLLGLRTPQGYIEGMLADAIFLRWMEVDATGGLAFAEKERFGSMAWWAWGKTDPAAALAAGLERRVDFPGTMVLRAIAQNDPARARELLERYPQFQQSSAMEGLASGLMKIDPAAGATMAAAWSDSIYHEKLISGWARREPEAALAWAQALPDLAKRAEAMTVLLDQWAVHHPEKVGPAIEALPESRQKWKLFVEHAKRLATVDPDAARAWAEAAPTPLLRREATVEMARGLATADPGTALEVLRGLDWSNPDWTRIDGPSFGRQRTLRPNGMGISGEDSLPSVVAEITAAAPIDGMTFVASLPATAPVYDLTRRAFQTWASRDSMAASEWLAGQPAGPTRHAGAEQLAMYLTQSGEPDFEAAAQWALSVPKEHERGNTRRRVFQEWHQRDAEAARAFLNGPDCPPEVRASMASLIKLE
jgi:hypothetical protein